MVATVVELLDKLDGPVVADTDREAFLDAVVSMVGLYASLDESGARAVRSKVRCVFDSVKMKGDNALTVVGQHAVAGMVALARQAEGPLAALEATRRIKEAQQSVLDQERRHHIDLHELRSKLEQTTANPDIMLRLCDMENLIDISRRFAVMVDFIYMLPQLCANLAAYMSNNDADKMQPLVMTLLAVKEAAADTSVATEVRSHLQHIENSCKVQDAALAAYNGALADFKSKAISVVGSAIKAFGGEEDDGIVATTQVSLRGTYTLKQQASYSETPKHDRDAIDLACVSLGLCSHATAISNLKTSVPKGFKIPGEVTSGLDAVLTNLDDSKPKLQWALGVEFGGQFLSLVRDMSAIVAPLKEKQLCEAMKKVTKAVKHLSALLAGSSGLADDKFFSLFTHAKMESVKKARADAKKALVDARLQHEAARVDIPEDIVVGDALVVEAHRKTVKYGFLAFVKNPDAMATSSAGAGVRKTLRSIWDTHRSDEELLKFFGKDLVDSVKEVLAFDAAPKRAAEPDAGSKKRRRTV